jgi:prepilin-type N-terminal cleavage/methylation domain-containing protein
MKVNKNKGFTLIELLVVIVIFALIANITIIALNKAKRESRDAKRMSNINQLRSALHLHQTDKSAFPDGDGISLGIEGNLVLDNTGWSDGSSPTSPIFMYSVPRDPRMVNKPSDPCTGASSDPCDYGYTLNANDYIIYFYLEGPVNNFDSGIHAATKDEIL